jgi:hypothetical protein
MLRSEENTMLQPIRPIRILAVALLAIGLSLVLPQTGAGQRPVSLEGLKEKDALRLIETSAPNTVFLVRGKAVRARDLQERLPAARQRAEVERQRAAQAARNFHPEDLAIARLRNDLAQHARALEQKAAFDSIADRLLRGVPPDSPEIQRLETEAASIASAWISADATNRRLLEERAQRVAAELRRLGVSVE